MQKYRQKISLIASWKLILCIPLGSNTKCRCENKRSLSFLSALTVLCIVSFIGKVLLKDAKPDILKAEKPEICRKFRKWPFDTLRMVPCRRAATRQVAKRKKAENPQEKQNPGSIDLQCPGESKWRDSVPQPQ